MSDPYLDDDDPIRQPEPGRDGPGFDPDLPPAYNVWKRALVMLVFALLFAVAETVLLLAALLQFGWMLFMRQKNAMIAEFGESFGLWLNRVVAFQTGRSEDKPFPWDRWGA